MYERLISLIGENNLDKLNKANILLVGVGGVGSAALEVLVRSGIRNITIVDFDVYEKSNLNRQIHATSDCIGLSKVDIVKKHVLTLDENINIYALNVRLDKESNLDFSGYDYIIDACDSIDAKIYLIKKAKEKNKKIISSLGVGNRVNPTDLKITTLYKTVNDPLGRKLRHELKKNEFYDDVRVVSSSELPIKVNPVGSYIGVSLTAGLLIADYVIKDIINDEN